MSNLASRTVTIPAGVGQNVRAAIVGNYFYALSATSGFQISIDDDPSLVQMVPGLGFKWPSTFHKLIFTNQTTTAVNVTFYAGTNVELFQEDAPTTIADTIMVCLGETALGAGGFFATVLGLPLQTANPLTPVSGHMKQIIITNLHATDRVQVCNGAGSVFDSVLAGQTKAYETSAWFNTNYVAGVRLFVPGANPITVDVGMIYWA
jgi:hypothetical protein